MRLTAGILALTLIARSAAAQGWDMRAAAAYLDSRQTWWSAWPTAARDHETACVSCHTALPYALARPSLRAAMHEKEPANPERKLLDDVVKRVSMWRDLGRPEAQLIGIQYVYWNEDHYPARPYVLKAPASMAWVCEVTAVTRYPRRSSKRRTRNTSVSSSSR